MKRMVAISALSLGTSLVLGAPAAAQQYPTPAVAGITVSDATLSCPQPFTVAGKGFVPGETVNITFDGQSIGSATVNDQGEFSAEVTSPDAAAGSHTVTASDSVSASATVTCVAGAAGVAFTGTNITVGLLVLVGLLMAGAAALLIGRRRARVEP
jgi:hypothetical protein